MTLRLPTLEKYMKSVLIDDPITYYPLITDVGGFGSVMHDAGRNNNNGTYGSSGIVWGDVTVPLPNSDDSRVGIYLQGQPAQLSQGVALESQPNNFSMECMVLMKAASFGSFMSRSNLSLGVGNSGATGAGFLIESENVGGGWLISGASIIASQWNLLEVVLDSANINYYLNGSLVYQVVQGGIVASGNYYSIGDFGSLPPFVYIAHCAWYSYPLSAGQIANRQLMRS